MSDLTFSKDDVKTIETMTAYVINKIIDVVNEELRELDMPQRVLVMCTVLKGMLQIQSNSLFKYFDNKNATEFLNAMIEPVINITKSSRITGNIN